VTRDAEQTGQTLTGAVQLAGLDVVDRSLDWLEARGRVRPAVASEVRPALRNTKPVLMRADALAGVLNRLILSALVLWVPAVCAWWVSSTLAALPMLVWYVAVAPILMRDIWAPADSAARVVSADRAGRTISEG
jgi:hypothetical protein